MRFLLKFAALGAAEKFLLLRAASALALFRLGLYLLPFPRLKTHSEKPPRRASKAAVSPAQIGLAISRASRMVPRSTCLVQALAAQQLLRRHHHLAVLHVGVRPENGQLLAHAWVECAGLIVVGGHEFARFTPILHPKNGDLKNL